MLTSHADVTTPDGARYLKRLCNHFAHKLPVELNEDRGVLRFDFGTCYLHADAAALHLKAEAADGEALARLFEQLARIAGLAGDDLLDQPAGQLDQQIVAVDIHPLRTTGWWR